MLHADKAGCNWGYSQELVFIRRAYLWRDVQHPFVQRRLPSSEPTQTMFRSPAAGQLCAVVGEHVVQGRVVLPGAAYLETMRAACIAVAKTPAGAALRGIFFLQPLVLASDATSAVWVECVLQPSGGG